MKKFLFVATAFLFSLAVTAQTKVDDVVKFGEEKHDFGKIKQGVPVTYAFEIKNISDKPVVVESANATCGCTIPEKIVDPIMPGATALLKVSYNAAAIGVFTKDVYVKLAGIDQPKTVQIVGEVVPAENVEIVKDKPQTTTTTKSVAVKTATKEGPSIGRAKN